ncbi:MAG: pilus assembly protein TadG-related protein [Pseudomonadota bacterium]
MKNVFRRFGVDEDAVIAIQVIIFSVMLLTASGMVIDFGRAYSAHSQMQGFVDKAALAAASELDGNSGAIDRATAAANSVSLTSSYVDSGAFAIKEIVFLNNNPEDDGTFDYSAIARDSLETTDDTDARYVLVIAAEASVRLSLLSMNIGGETSDVSDVAFTTYAVARYDEAICGGLTNLVMCNPFEDTGESFSDKMTGLAGAQMMLTSDLDMSGAPQLSTDGGAIRLGLLANPADEIGGDFAGICSDSNLLATFGGTGFVETKTGGVGSGWDMTTTDAVEKLRDMCMLAMLESDIQCLSSEVIVKPATPEVIVTALNTAFDIWDEPMDRVLVDSSLQSEFAPDYVAVHGGITREELALISADLDAEAAASGGDPYDALSDSDKVTADEYAAYAEFYATRAETYEGLLGATHPATVAAVTQRDNYQTLYDGLLATATVTLDPALVAKATNWASAVAAYPDTVENEASRVNHIYRAESSWGPLYRATCLNSLPATCSTSLHSNIASPQANFSEYFASYYYPTMEALTMDLDNPATLLETTIASATTYYEGYQNVERQESILWVENASHGHGSGYEHVETAPAFYPFTSTSYSGIQIAEPRRKRIAVVNCTAMETHAEYVGFTDPSYTGTYVAQVEEVVDVYLTEAADVVECLPGTVTGADPWGINPCWNHEISDAKIYAEFIAMASDGGISDMTTRSYAVLVH